MMHELSGTDDVPEQTRGGAVDPQCLGMPLTEPDRNANSNKQGFMEFRGSVTLQRAIRQRELGSGD